MPEQNFDRLLQIIAGQKIQFKTPIGLVMLSAKVKDKLLTLKLSAKIDGKVMSANLVIGMRNSQIKIHSFEGLDAILIVGEEEIANPMASKGVGTFLVNSLILILQDIFASSLYVSGVLQKPKFREVEVLAARRNFWRNFGFSVTGESGRDIVTAKLNNLKIYPRPLFDSDYLKGKNLLDQHLI